MSDRYTTVRIDRKVHERATQWAEHWGLTRSDALTMLVTRGLAAAEGDAVQARDLQRERRERESARAKAIHAAPSYPPPPASERTPRTFPEPVPHRGEMGPANAHLVELRAAVEMLTVAITGMQAQRQRRSESGTELVAVGAERLNGTEG